MNNHKQLKTIFKRYLLIEIRQVVVSGTGGNRPIKDMREALGVNEMFYILLEMVVITHLSVTVETHQTVQLKSIYVIYITLPQ